jgi:hypothetical protein
MTSRIVDRIKRMDPKELTNLEANAKRLISTGTAKQKAEAAAALDSIL